MTRLYPYLAWGLPLLLTLAVWVGADYCTLPPERLSLTYQIPDIMTFSFSCVMLFSGWKKARSCLVLLDLTGNSRVQGTVHSDSISHWKVYLGMFLTFGVIRAPSVLVAIVHICSPNSLSAEHEFSVTAAAIVAPIQGFFMFIWFAIKFR